MANDSVAAQVTLMDLKIEIVTLGVENSFRVFLFQTFKVSIVPDASL